MRYAVIASVIVVALVPLAYLQYRESSLREEVAQSVQLLRKQDEVSAALRKAQAVKAAREQTVRRDAEQQVSEKYWALSRRHGDFERHLRDLADVRNGIGTIQQAILGHPPGASAQYIVDAIDRRFRPLPERENAHMGNDVERMCSLELRSAFLGIVPQLKIAADNRVWGRPFEQQFADVASRTARFDALLNTCHAELRALAFQLRDAKQELDRLTLQRKRG